MSSKKPSSVKACRDVADLISSLKEGSHLLKIVNNGLDVLKGHMFAGERVERKKFPRYYLQKFGINNLYKLNLDSRTRLIYTLVAEESGVAVVVLEIFGSQEVRRKVRLQVGFEFTEA